MRAPHVAMGVLVALCVVGSRGVAQGRLARAANRMVSLTADIALARAVTIDVAGAAGGMAPPPAPYGALQASVRAVDVVNGVVARVHLALYNPGETPVTEPIPDDSAFVLVDGTGTRFQLASVRSKEVAAGPTFTVPALERINVALVFLLNKSVATDAVLKVGNTLIIRGVPIRREVPPP